MIKSEDLQSRSLNLTKISLRIEGEIKSFLDKKKLNELVTTKPILHEMLKGLLQEKEEEKKIKNMNSKMAKRYISINK